ncbi:cysteine--tRNA ligase [Dethiobacter alkaliphilus]|uniref:cysteine--tRNA ligase n=1 Tax=Dethiobacter alkaliphilus TaxID=427926 RepID=UPI0029620D7B|nr:cysteine--tRNA ligase [Dethiobacter alkaliphilus]
MSVRVFNTLTRKKEEFVPVEGKKVGIYACGPTVYDYFHIGNARIFIVFDVIRRYLRWRGYDVTFVQNFTDIDDKMIKRANELGITVPELAERYIEAYFEDVEALGVEPADVHPKATEHIEEMVELIQKLEAKGMAYEVDGDVYFHTPAFDNYGELSHQPLDELESGARVDVDERKKHPLDFVLWKKQKPGEPAWESPWGKGRPGWHIECSVMSSKYLGDTLDIHAGGPDLIFPHHENEKAQSEGATGKPFAKYWLHAGYLNINQEKMSKSLGNFMTVREIRKQINPEIVRFFMLSAHYRNPINYSPDLLEQAKSGLDRLSNVVYNLRDLLEKLPEGQGDSADAKERLAALEAHRGRFVEAMDDDFNTADGLAVLFDVARETNAYLKNAQVSRQVVEQTLALFEELGSVLGFFQKQDDEDLDATVNEMIEKRQAARKEKDWATADAIRDQLQAMGIVLEDTPQGIRWRRK